MRRPGTARRRRGRLAVAAVAVVAGAAAAACAVPAPQLPEPPPEVVAPVPDDSVVVRGYVDAHNHMFSDVGFGGGLLCGRTFHPDGIAAALKDCPDHMPNGELALFENLTRTGDLGGTHDPTGWPTFADWPGHDSLTHQQTYHEWVRRAWEGGLRVMVNDLVTNRQLCEFWPAGNLPCDEMDSIRRQAEEARRFEAYVDDIYGGPGRGWYRLVDDAAEARRVIAEGKLAVILGVETSEPFGCRVWNGVPRCTEADIDAGLDEMYALGVRSMFVCHKFDNALCGVRFDSGTIGVIINLGQKVSSNRFWSVEPCPDGVSDNTITPAGSLPAVLGDVLRPGDLPLYPPAPHCNPHGLTELGRHMVEGMMERNMIVEVDHMSAKAADQTLSILEAAGYPGVVSTHSWTQPSNHERIYALGGMVTQYGHGSEEFVEEWHDTEDLRDRYGVAGYGFGIDANGFGGLPPPPQHDPQPVTYPFEALDGRSLERAHTGLREWDYNSEGMAHYGLMPDWIEDMRTLGGEALVDDLAHGAEQYLRTLEATEAFG